MPRLQTTRLGLGALGGLLLVWSSLITAGQAPHVITRVVNGDTVIVSGFGSTRLVGVDTPETVDPRRPVQFLGAEASAFLKRLALGQTVRVEFDQTRTDRFGRTLAYLYLEDGTFINAEIIRQGYGHAYLKYPFRYRDQFRDIEREAREHGRGLWATPPSQ